MEDPTAVLERVGALLDELHALPTSCWSTVEKAQWLTGVQVLRARVDALCVDAAVAARDCGVVNLEPDPKLRTLQQFVAERGGIDPATVGSDLHLAGRLTRFPVVAAAFRAGELTRSHVLHILDLDNPATTPTLRAAQQILVDAGRDCRWAGFAEVCANLMVYADTDGTLADERVRGRRASIKANADGTVTGSFRLDPLTGRACKEAIDREIQRLTDIDEDPGNPDAKHRTPGQRAADALANLVTKGSANPDAKLAPPLIHIVMGDDALAECLARRHARTHGGFPVGPDGQLLDDDLRIDNTDPARRCELIDRTPIHPDHVAGLLDTADIRRIVLGPDDEILDHGRPVRLDQATVTAADIRRTLLDAPSETLHHGRTRRLYPHHDKLALLVTHRGRCAEPGCDAPLAWLQADHIHPWSKGGATDITNGAIRCAACNKAKRDTVPTTLQSKHGPSGDGPPDGGPPDEPLPWTDEPLPFDRGPPDDAPRAA